MIKDEFRELIIGNFLLNKNIVIVNIGTHKYIGDSCGPLLGSMLENQLKMIKVYGTLNDTINAINLNEKMDFINEKHKDDLIIGVDSAFSEYDEDTVEPFCLCDTPFKPGTGIDKHHLQEVGHISIQFCMKQELENIFASLNTPTIKDIYNRTRKAAEFIFDLDEYLSVTNRTFNMNRQEVK